MTIWDDEHHAFMCMACEEVMDLDDTNAPELSERERKQLQREQERQLQEAKRDRDRKQAEVREQVDAELEAIKRRLGKS